MQLLEQSQSLLSSRRVPLLSSAGGPNLDFDMSFLFMMALFTAMILILKPLLFDPVLKIFEERELRTDGVRDEARTMQERAGDLLTRYEQELERAQGEVRKEPERLRAETAKMEAEILEEGRRTVSRILEEGRKAADLQVQKLSGDLGAQSEGIAKDIARQLLGREVA